MRRAFALFLALGGCGFRSQASPDAAVAELDAAADAAEDAALEAPAAFCDPADPHLVVCYELEGDTRDGSSHHLDATAADVSFPDGKVGKAMQFGATSAADVADSGVFDVAALTIEAWIRPSELPTGGGRAGVLDMDGQYGVFVRANGALSCSLVGAPSPPTTAARFEVGTWSHVACTYDGNVATMYVDGVAIASNGGGGALHTDSRSGISIASDNPPGAGSRLIGLIDQVRMLDIARTAAQICRDAGRTDCAALESSEAQRQAERP